MPIKNSKLKVMDPFVMNEDRVNQLVANFFKSRGFDSIQYFSGKETGIDVQAEKSGWRAYVESKGSQANHHDEDTVFDTSQIKVHTYNQVGKLMEYQSAGAEKTLLILANPNIPRIREKVNKVEGSLDKLGFIRFWVEEDGVRQGIQRRPRNLLTLPSSESAAHCLLRPLHQ